MFNHPETGQMKIERVFFKSVYPVLFTCRSDKDVLYLCVCFCSDKVAQRWLISETTPSIVIDMLKDKTTLRNAFLLGGKGRFTVSKELNNVETIASNVIDDWCAEESTSLPTADAYLDADEGEFNDDITFYEIEQFKHGDINRLSKMPAYISPHSTNSVFDFDTQFSMRATISMDKDEIIKLLPIKQIKKTIPALPQTIIEYVNEQFVNRSIISFNNVADVSDEVSLAA